MTNIALLFLQEAENAIQHLEERYEVRLQSLYADPQIMLRYRNKTTGLTFMWDVNSSRIWLEISRLIGRDYTWLLGDPKVTSTKLEFIMRMKGLPSIESELERCKTEDELRIRLRGKLADHLDALCNHAEPLLRGDFADLESANRWRKLSEIGDRFRCQWEPMR